MFSCVWLFETPWTVAHQAPLSMGFSRQEYWSGLPFPSMRIFLTQGLNPGLPHCRQMLYHLSYQGSLLTVLIFHFSLPVQHQWIPILFSSSLIHSSELFYLFVDAFWYIFHLSYCVLHLLFFVFSNSLLKIFHSVYLIMYIHSSSKFFDHLYNHYSELFLKWIA